MCIRDSNNPYHPFNIEAYKDIPRNMIPDTESLKDTYERVVPYYKKNILPLINENIIVAAHGNSIRSLCKYLFEIDSVDLSFREEALKSIAKRAIARKTGARGLRSILEDILMDVMFELPNEDLEKVIIDENSADNGSEPIKVFKTPKKKSSAS